MNLDRLLPGRTFEAAHPAGMTDAREALRRALAEEAAFPMVRWKVVGWIEGDDVHLWYTLRKRPPSLAPELVARWEPAADGGTRLVGRFTQNRRMAIAVGALGAVLALGLLSTAAQGALPLHWALLGSAVLAGYPWLAWFMYENHIEKIAAVVKRALGGPAGADAAHAAVPDEIR
jgi:hypothetical protein